VTSTWWIPAVSLACAACGKKAPTCEQVWDHIVSLAPAPMRGGFAAVRAREIATCERELTADERRCVLASRDIDDLEQCRAGKSQPPMPPPPPPRAGDTTDVRDLLVRFAGDDGLRDTTVEVTGYAVSIANDIPLTRRGERIYPVAISDQSALDRRAVTISCVGSAPVTHVAVGARVRASGRLGGTAMDNPELSQVELDGCTLTPASP
jgi:hypothetical protein